MEKARCWIEAMRLRTLPVSVAGVFTAWGYNIASGTFKAVPAVLCLVFAVLCQIASNFANEYYDYKAGRDSAGREGPRRGVTEGDLTPAAMRRATFGTLGLAALVGLSLTSWGGLWLIAAGVLIGLGALAYSAGPWPFSTHCLGEVAVVVFFGIVPVNLTYYVQALQWSMPVMLGSLAMGLMIANVLIVNNYRDIPDDRAVGKHTLATTFGRTAMRVLYFLNSLVAVAIMVPQWRGMDSWPGIFVPVYIFVSLIIALRIGRLYGKALTPMLGITAMMVLLYALAFLLASII